MASIIVSPSQRFIARAIVTVFSFFLIKWIFWDSKPTTPPGEIAHPAILERIALGTPLSGQILDTRKNPFLQTRINRDETPDLFDGDIRLGMNDFWNRFQKPFSTSSETVHLDEQVVRGAVDELLGFNGWAAAACSSLTRPFGMQKKDDDWSDLSRPGALYYFALVVHGADHFLIDQLAVIVQLSKRLGPNSIFVSLVDYASNDSTPFICDMAEAVMILLGISFRIRQVPPMTSDPTASYYPLEEAYTRNLALEPLVELWTRRKLKFTRVIWLKGFTCPNDILETLRVSVVNQASMVCSMDWKEHNGFFIYNDRWRTRDMDGNLFRGSKSTSPIDEAPPRDDLGGARYTLHLPFQVFCCESGSHIVDPHKSYYEGVTYQSSVAGVTNTSTMADGKTPRWSEGPCMDSSQLHFCRDMWMVSFREGVRKEAKRLAAEERKGKGRNVHPFMEDVIQAMQASYAPTTSDRVGYANSGDYLADETGVVAEGVGGGVEGTVDDDDDEDGDEEDGDDVDVGGDGRPIDLAVDLDDAGGAAAAIGVGSDDDEPAPAAKGGKAAPPAVDDPAGVMPKGPAAAGKNAPAKPPNPVGAEDAVIEPVRPPPPAKAPGGGAPKEKRALEKKSGSRLEKRKPRSLPNSEFGYGIAKILVNPRCVTTYAGVSHTQLALDLFGTGEDQEPAMDEGGKYALEEWRTAPESFVCQEMRTTGGRIAAKQQRRTGFQQARLLINGWRPT
ncbi:glycosyltransferase family 69 protein [Pseudohyphozyma bogoriensis]|nr:glycosyltransferase family 69 protein [Pseudohyphozyma bogoriensis]